MNIAILILALYKANNLQIQKRMKKGANSSNQKRDFRSIKATVTYFMYVKAANKEKKGRRGNLIENKERKWRNIGNLYIYMHTEFGFY